MAKLPRGFAQVSKGDLAFVTLAEGIICSEIIELDFISVTVGWGDIVLTIEDHPGKAGVTCARWQDFESDAGLLRGRLFKDWEEVEKAIQPFFKEG